MGQCLQKLLKTDKNRKHRSTVKQTILLLGERRELNLWVRVEKRSGVVDQIANFFRFLLVGLDDL